MGRPPLPVGTWDTIRTEKLGPHRFCARVRFRDYDGKTQDIEATDITGPAAVRALKTKLRDRTTPNDDEITLRRREDPVSCTRIRAVHRWRYSYRSDYVPIR